MQHNLDSSELEGLTSDISSSVVYVGGLWLEWADLMPQLANERVSLEQSQQSQASERLESDLWHLFSSFGALKSVCIYHRRIQGKAVQQQQQGVHHQLMGLVEFELDQDALAAIDNMHLAQYTLILPAKDQSSSERHQTMTLRVNRWRKQPQALAGWMQVRQQQPTGGQQPHQRPIWENEEYIKNFIASS